MWWDRHMGYDAPRPFVAGSWMDVPSASELGWVGLKDWWDAPPFFFRVLGSRPAGMTGEYAGE